MSENMPVVQKEEIMAATFFHQMGAICHDIVHITELRRDFESVRANCVRLTLQINDLRAAREIDQSTIKVCQENLEWERLSHEDTKKANLNLSAEIASLNHCLDTIQGVSQERGRKR